MPAEQEPTPELLTLALIRRHYVPGGERTIRRWISCGIFPRPDISVGGKTNFWKKETVEQWIDAQGAGVANQMDRAKGNHVVVSYNIKRNVFTAMASGTAVAITLIICGFVFLIVWLKFCR